MDAPVVFISLSPDSKSMEIKFNYGNRCVSFTRAANDSVKQFLQRCELKLKSPPKKNNKTATSVESENVSVSFIVPGCSTFENLELSKVALDGRTKLKINDVVYDIVVNLPEILSAAVPQHAMAKCVIQPVVELQHSTHFKCTWYLKLANGDFSLACQNQYFEPSVQHVGMHLKVEITPCYNDRKGNVVSVSSKEPIQAPVGETPVSVRQQLTRMTSRGADIDFRVVSYNILADCYVFTDWALKTMYPHCPRYVLPMDYRKQLLYREFMDYNGDILALQEVESKFFKNELDPFLGSLNMKGLYSSQNGRRNDGEAIFFNADKFDLIEENTLLICEYCYSSDLLTAFLAVCSHDLREDFLCRSTTFQFCVLRLKGRDKFLLVVNTHFAAKHSFDSVRFLQAVTLSEFAKEKCQSIRGSFNISESDLGLLMLGDFNSSPDAFATRYFHHEQLDIEELDPLSAGIDFKVKMPEELTCVRSAYPKYSIEFTNMVHNFTSTLDWIYFTSDSLSCVNRLPMPSLESVAAFGGLPNVGMASDHLALVADFAFLSTS